MITAFYAQTADQLHLLFLCRWTWPSSWEWTWRAPTRTRTLAGSATVWEPPSCRGPSTTSSRPQPRLHERHRMVRQLCICSSLFILFLSVSLVFPSVCLHHPSYTLLYS